MLIVSLITSDTRWQLRTWSWGRGACWRIEAGGYPTTDWAPEMTSPSTSFPSCTATSRTSRATKQNPGALPSSCLQLALVPCAPLWKCFYGELQAVSAHVMFTHKDFPYRSGLISSFAIIEKTRFHLKLEEAMKDLVSEERPGLGTDGAATRLAEFAVTNYRTIFITVNTSRCLRSVFGWAPVQCKRKKKTWPDFRMSWKQIISSHVEIIGHLICDWLIVFSVQNVSWFPECCSSCFKPFARRWSCLLWNSGNATQVHLHARRYSVFFALIPNNICFHDYWKWTFHYYSHLHIQLCV